MADLIFTRLDEDDGFALYQAQAPESDQAAAVLSFLFFPDGSGQTPPQLDLLAAWQAPGVFLFSALALSVAPQQLADLLSVSPPYASKRGMSWITCPLPESFACTTVPLSYMSPNSGQVNQDTGLAFGHTQLLLPSQATLTLSAEPPQAVFGSEQITLQRTDGQGYPLQPDNDQIALSLDPAAPGGLSFTGQWLPYYMFATFADDPNTTGQPGGEVRYFHSDAQSGAVDQLRYPVLPQLPSIDSPDQWPTLLLDCRMAPLAPFDGTRTAFIFQPQDLGFLASAVGSTVAGDAVTLTPLTPANGPRAGLYPAARPATAGAEGDYAYLAPIGPFAVTLAADSDKLMCGTAGIEYLQVCDGDILNFVPSKPAYASDDGLDETYNTSWVQLHAGAANAPRGYYAQPGASVSFGRGTLAGPMNFPGAVSSLISRLDHEAAPAFPLAVYGGVFSLADGVAQDAGALAQFEKKLLTPTRGAQIRGPVLAGAMPPPPVFGNHAGEPLSGARTATPQGLLVQLNDGGASGLLGATAAAGTWQSLALARSGERYLRIKPSDDSGIVDTVLANALTSDQLFMVLNDWKKFPNIDSELQVAGFNFNIAPAADDPAARKTVLVFKYATELSLVDMIAQTTRWADSGYFVGGEAQVLDAQATLQAALQTAEKAKEDKDDPFGAFRAIMNDARWTGMLAFNAPINGNGMPPDLQMLFAGIDQPLKAHHFGVLANRVADDKSATPQPQISESSLFGVIYYHAGPPAPPPSSGGPDYVFSVEELAVAISNSVVSQFHCRVGMTIAKLFGRAVTQQGVPSAGAPANTVVVAGQYQRLGGVGTVTFNSPGDCVFLFNADSGAVRVLESFTVTGASLVPLASEGSTIKSRFTLNGALKFATDPFPGVTGLDLYSYDALQLGGLAFAIACKLNAAGVQVPPVIVVPELSALRPTNNQDGQRTTGLARMMPLKLTAILQNPEGLEAKALGGMSVNIPTLTGVAVAQPDGESAQAAYLTSQPQYALQFSLPLGSLGALADAHASLDASLVVAWGPSTYTPDNDGAAIYVQLPQVTAGAFGFNLQGLLKTTFGDANLGLVQAAKGPAYVLMFNNVALSVLGITLPPKVISDLILFADATAPNSGSLGWSLAATQTS